MGNPLWLCAAVFLCTIFLDLYSSGVNAQVTNATCSPSYDWAKNSRGQSPCLVAAYVAGDCADSNSGYMVQGLPSDDMLQTYSPPDVNHSCQCSTGYYSLISACAACQGHKPLIWDTWKKNCIQVVINKPGSLSFSGTEVPSWAYIDVTIQGYYDATTARAVAETAATQSSTTATSSGDTNSPTLASDSNNSAGSKTNTGAIAGGVVGGVVFLALTTLGVVYLLRRHRRNSGQRNRGAVIVDGSSSDLGSENVVPKMAMLSNNGSSFVGSASSPSTGAGAGYTSHGWSGAGATQGHMHSRSMSSGATSRMIGSPEPSMQRFYDPDDPSTHPPPVDPSDVTSLRTMRTTAGYTGAAEV